MKENINGVSVHYRVEGEGKSKVLLLHGWGCDMSMMQPVADALKQTHSVLLVDFPGHGQSGRPPEPWGVPEYAECIDALLQKLSFFPCSVIAHSFGCRITTWLEKEKPSLIHKIVFTGAAGIRPQPSAEAQKRNKRYQKLKRYSEMLKKLPLMGSVAEDMQQKLRQHYGSPDYNALDDEMRKTFIKVIQLDLTEYYNSFQSSTLLIWGDADTETPLWMAKEMANRIPDCGLVILEGGSHFAYLEQISRFNTIVRQFLKEEE